MAASVEALGVVHAFHARASCAQLFLRYNFAILAVAQLYSNFFMIGYLSAVYRSMRVSLANFGGSGWTYNGKNLVDFITGLVLPEQTFLEG